MSKEIEVKVLGVSLMEMENKLKELGAELVAEEYQINTVIDTKDRYIEKHLNSYLRIRETSNLLTGKRTIKLTLKKNIGKEKARENIEITTAIDDKKAMLEILKNLQFNVVQEGYKKRKTYVYENIRFDLDKWDENTYPYEYMEIEVKKEEDLDKAIELLDINKEQISTKSIMELREEEDKKCTL
ncbi:MAG: class IV adenylate cyclase [Tissierellia bacterium]|nr:class IV adenylate cyclase [Tissierellia bacterium]